MPASSAPLPVGMVTTWGAHCGISTYSEELIPHLDDLLETPVAVLSENAVGAEHGAIPAMGFMPIDGAARPQQACWNRRNPYGNATSIGQAVRQWQLKVVHFQHEFGLWPNEKTLQDSMRACRSAGARVVVTMHTVFPFGGPRRSGTLQMIGRLADTVIVHTVGAYAALAASSGAGPRRAKIELIPHGTARRMVGDREAGLEFINAPVAAKDVVWGLVFGFQGRGKNIIATIRAFAEARARRMVKNCGLLIAGKVWDELYDQRVNGVAMESGYLSAIYKYDKFVKEEQAAHLFAAADFGILNNLGGQPAPLSASGQAHLYASYGVPLACANVPIYSEAINAGAAVPFGLDLRDTETPTLSAINAVAALANDYSLRKRLGDAAMRFAKETAWERVAERTAEVYAETLTRSGSDA